MKKSKIKGKNLGPTQIEVDISGRIENTSKNTFFAFSNHKNRCIKLSSESKRKIIDKLRRAGKIGKSFYLQIYISGLFILLKDFVGDKNIVIDIEYISHEREIKQQLLNRFRNSKVDFDSNRINFGHVGKNSPAHNLAIKHYRNKRISVEEIKFESILKLILKEKKIGGSVRRKT